MTDMLPAIPGEVEEQPAAATYQDVTRRGDRKPLVAEQWQRHNVRGTLQRGADLHWYKTRWHFYRLHLHVPLFLWYSVRGAGRLVARLHRWLHWTPGYELVSQAVAAGRPGHGDAMRAHTEIERTRQRRGMLLLIYAVPIAAALLLMVKFVPWWGWLLLAPILLRVLAHHGKPHGKPLIEAAIVPPLYEKPTHQVITDALGSLGIKAINDVVSDGRQLAFLTDVYRDGEGWGCDLDLPRGVTAAMILKNREQLSSGLRRPLSATWPSGVPHEHEARLRLWIGFTDMSKMKQPPWPLLKAGQPDIFTRVPFAYNPRGQGVNVPLFETNWLIGAAPGEGKTGAVRVLACAAALDPICDLWVHEQAGKGDLEAFAQVSHRYCSGLDDESIGYAAQSLSMLRAEMEERSALFKKIPRERRPDGKLTRELARDRRLRPVVAIFDEVQNVFWHPKHGAQAADDAAYVIRLGRAYGIILILATQRPDKDSLPTTVSGMVTARFCLKVPDQVGNDMILGTGAYKSGFNSVVFRHEIDAGLGWLRGTDDPEAVRTYYLDLNAAAKVCARARMARQAAGVLSGYALGEDDTAMPRDVLGDVLAILNGDTGIHWTVLAERLAQAFPDRWADASADAVSAQVRALGVPSVDVRSGGRTLKGCRARDIEVAADR